jgi:AcrR family transcriptional regulator
LARKNVARTKRGERTRRQILDVTRRLLAQPGFRGVTLDQIAEATGTAKSSILWHFGTKEELLLEVLDGIVHDLERSYRQSYPASLPLTDKMRLFFKGYASLMEQYPELGTVFFGLIFDTEMIERIRDRVKEMYCNYRQMVVHHLSTPSHPASEGLAVAVVALLDGVFIQWYLDPQRIELEKVFESVVSGLESLRSGGSARGAVGSVDRGPAEGIEPVRSTEKKPRRQTKQVKPPSDGP